MVELEPEVDGLVPEPTLLYSLSTGEQARRDGGREGENGESGTGQSPAEPNTSNLGWLTSANPSKLFGFFSPAIQYCHKKGRFKISTSSTSPSLGHVHFCILPPGP